MDLDSAPHQPRAGVIFQVESGLSTVSINNP